MRAIYIAFMLIVSLYAIPNGAIAPGCTTPQSADSTAQWCVNQMMLNNINTANTASPTPFVFTTSSFCSANTTYMAPTIAQYGQFSNSPPSYGSSNYNKFIQICNITTTGGAMNVTCRYSKTLTTTTDYLLGGFFAMSTNFTYGNITQTYIQGGFFTANDSRVFSNYCALGNDTTIPSSHFMPPSCISIISNAAAMNICQAALMENMPACDSVDRLSSSQGYRPSAFGGKAVCTVPAGTPVAGLSPMVCSSMSVFSSDPTKYIEGCGSISAGVYFTGNPNVQFISVSPADRLQMFLDAFFY